MDILFIIEQYFFKIFLGVIISASTVYEKDVFKYQVLKTLSHKLYYKRFPINHIPLPWMGVVYPSLVFYFCS